MKEKIISLSLIFTLLFSSFSLGAEVDDIGNLVGEGKDEEIIIQDPSENSSLDDVNPDDRDNLDENKPDEPGEFESEETEDIKSKEVDGEQEKIQPTMNTFMPVNATSKTVKNEDKLREAIKDDSIEEIIIENDIELEEELDISLKEGRELKITSEVTDLDLWNKEDSTVKDIDELDLPKITSNITNGENMISVRGSGSLTIENLILDGNDDSRILKIDNINNLLIDNIVLLNGKTNSKFYGNGINAESTSITIRNSAFLDIKGKSIATQESGRKENNLINDLIIENTIFRKEKEQDIKPEFGGAIEVSKGYRLLIEDSHFLNNKVKQSGGAIVIHSKHKVLIKNSLFKENETEINSGGAIFANEGNEIEIRDSIFIENKARGGGAIYLGDNSSLEISEVDFLRNMSDKEWGSQGGAIDSHNSDVVIRNSNFKENRSKGDDGGSGGAINLVSGMLKIDETNFLKNKSEFYGDFKDEVNGGAISISNYINKKESKLEINMKSVTFKDNESEDGGAIYIHGHFGGEKIDCRLFNVNFNNNVADIGGGICLSGNTSLNIEGDKNNENKSEFHNNKAIYGGALAFDDLSEGEVKIGNIIFNKNEAARTGGAIYIFKPDYIGNEDWWKDDYYKNIHIDNTVEFKNNTTEDPLRFINGFEEEKYNDYKEIADKIEPKSQSYGASPFNNYDINMLGYEYYVAYKAPEDLKGKFSFKYDGKSEEFDIEDKELLFDKYLFNEVFKKEDDRTINIEPGAVIEYKREKDGKIETVEATLQSWDISEEDMNSTEKEEKDFILTGVWKEEITKTEEKPIDPEEDKEKPTEPVDPGKPIDPEIKPVDPGKEGETEELETGKPEQPIGPGKPGNPYTPEIEDKLNLEDHLQYIEGYPDQTVRPEDNISREEVAAIIFRILNPEYRSILELKESKKLLDINKGRWSEKYIGILESGNIVLGYPDGRFKPTKPITRGEVAAMIVRFSNEEIIGEHNLIDIEDHWAEDYIGYAVSRDWLEGYSDKTFKPDQAITRGELVTIINGILERGTTIENMIEDRKEFKDLKEDKWYYEAMQEAINGHIYTKDYGIEIWTELKQFDIEM